MCKCTTYYWLPCVFTAGRTMTPGNILFQMPPCVFLSFCYKIYRHSQLMHMCIRYHFLADLHITRYAVHTAFNQI